MERSLLIFASILAAASLAMTLGMIYAAVHFIFKFW